MSQIIKKFIGANQVDETKIRLTNNVNLRARNAANSADVNILKVNASDAVEFASLPIFSGSSLATQVYVNARNIASYRAVAIGDVNVDVTNPGTAVFDSVTVTIGQTILLIGQSVQTENGLWVFDTTATPLTRPVNWQTGNTVAIDTLVVTDFGGTVYQNEIWKLRAQAVIGTDILVFDGLTGAAAGANTSLSNLVSTAINVSLVPAADNSIDLGTGANRYAGLYASIAYHSSGTQVINLDARQLLDTGNSLVLEWSNPSFANMQHPWLFVQLAGLVGTSGTSTFDYTIRTNDLTAAALAVDTPSGNLNLLTGDATGVGPSGIINITTGATENIASGVVNISTGTPSTSGASGGINIFTPNAPDGGGPINVTAGSATVGGSAGGAITLTGGGGGPTDGPGGTITINAGAAQGVGMGGNIQITGGSSPGGPAGNITLTPNSGVSGLGFIVFNDSEEGTPGHVWTEVGDVSGGGRWRRPLTPGKDSYTLSGTDITNQYVDLTQISVVGSYNLLVKGAGGLLEGVDYTADNSGPGGNGRITFINDLATGGLSALVAGDVVEVQYTY